MTTPTPPRETALSFLHAWAASDMDTARNYLAEDITFESPQTSLTGAHAVAEVMDQFAQAVEDITVLVVADDGDHVVVMYDMHTGPFGTIRAAEHYTIRDGHIVADVLVFDTASLHQQ
ncbi:nuclear transport factor 2 family protein [Barrientosiimonas endolithica]|uniref:SnoaL-like domain-containing protein n=1 Tax=Barrientosiimonas endolithica TaxID=1535208 RepID=A0ABM8HEE1_9MICO|nr:nuclear transport factor 2 family protein [Barrientosiimonas endolithica]BDZ59356.1 hypothetical protein GCM10025872_30130 [Barrientosiimonas endolithica]